MKGDAMTRTRTLLGLAAVAVAGVFLGAGEAPRQISSSDLDTKAIVVIGTLGKPLGTYMTVEGAYHGPPSMVRWGMEINKIDGAERQIKGLPAGIEVDDRESNVKLQAGHLYRLRGFETGGFRNVPYDPQNPPTPEQIRGRQAATDPVLQFHTLFYVSKAEDLGPIPVAQGAR
jgi:hypothetical protein